MDSPATEISHNFPPFFRVYNDGRVERYMVSDYVPPAVDPQNGVAYEDISISSETGVKARVFKPMTTNRPDQKLPLVVHYHGGGFCIGSAFGTFTKRFLTSLVTKSNLVAVSIGYRLAPENPLPIAYDDSWSALQWIAAHTSGQGPDPWLNQYVDFTRVFLLGESAGATLAHHVSVRAGVTRLDGLNLRGVILVHPFFTDNEPDKMIQYLYPGSSGSVDDPRLNPKADPDLAKMGCDKVLVYVAENDGLRARGLNYCVTLRNSGWGGSVELVENEGEGHCFHLFNPKSEKVASLMEKLVSFINQG